MAANFLIDIHLTGTPAQLKALLDALGGDAATGIARAVVRQLRRQGRAALLATKDVRVGERPPLVADTAKLIVVDQQIADIDAALPDFVEP